MRKPTKVTTLWIAGGLVLAAVACEQKTTPVTTTSGAVAGPTTNAPGGSLAATPSDPIANAENKDRVKQYPNEVKMTPTPARLFTGTVTFVREATDGATTIEEVETIPTGVVVQEVARDKDYYLVLYPDPNDASRQKAGWVYKDALESSTWPMISSGGMSAAAASSPANLGCKTNESHLRTGHDFCAHECSTDADCKSGMGVCDGVAFEVKKNGTTSKDAERYCVVNGGNPSEGSNTPMK